MSLAGSCPWVRCSWLLVNRRPRWPMRRARLARPACRSGLSSPCGSTWRSRHRPRLATEDALAFRHELVWQDELRADAQVALLQGLTGLRGNRRAGRLAESILAAPEQERRDVVIAAQVAQAMIMWDRGRLAEALDMSAEAVRIATDQQPDARQSHPQLFLSSPLADLRRIDSGRSLIPTAA